MYSFKKIDNNEIEWDMIEKCYDHIVYKSRAWVGHLANNYGVSPFILTVHKNEEQIGFFIGGRFKKVISIIAAPFEGWQTPFQGLSIFAPISVKQRLEIYKSLEEYLFKNNECSYFQVTDFYLDLENVAHSKFKYEICAGYILDISLGVEDLFRNMGNSAKNPIKAAKNRGIIVQEPKNIAHFIDEYYKQLVDVFAKQHLKPTHKISDIADQISAMVEANKILMLEAVLSDGTPLASTFFIYDNDTAFWLGAASDSKYQKLSANEPLMFEAIKELKLLGIKKLEMGGGRNYKEKYGPLPYVRPRIISAKCHSILILKSFARKLFYRRRKIGAYFKERFSK